MPFRFKAKIYKTGINWAIDVPPTITSKMIAKKGYIKVSGTINKFQFTTNLVPVKGSPYRLFVNGIMMKGGKTAIGETATFVIEQDLSKKNEIFRIPALLKKAFEDKVLHKKFKSLTPSRRKDILRYLSRIKTEDTLKKNVSKLIARLNGNNNDVRVP